MMTVLIGMFLLGLLIALGTWTVSWSNHVKHELVVKIDMNTNSDKGGEATHAQENAVARSLSAQPARRHRSSSSPRRRPQADAEDRGRAAEDAAVQPVPGHVHRHADEGGGPERALQEPASARCPA